MVTLREALGRQLAAGAVKYSTFPVHVLNQVAPTFNSKCPSLSILAINSTDIDLYTWDSVEEIPNSVIPRVVHLRLK
jgi:hypothetical protein